MERFRLEQVERITGVAGAKVAYWLTEFPELQSLAREEDSGEITLAYEGLGLVLRIQLLLEETGLTIAGVRKQLEADGKPEPGGERLRERLLRVRRELAQVKEILEE